MWTPSLPDPVEAAVRQPMGVPVLERSRSPLEAHSPSVPIFMPNGGQGGASPANPMDGFNGPTISGSMHPMKSVDQGCQRQSFLLER